MKNKRWVKLLSILFVLTVFPLSILANKKALLNRVEQNIKKNRLEIAADILKSKYSTYENDVDVNYQLGKIYFLMQKYHWSKKYLNKTMELSKDHKDTSLLLFQIYYEMREMDNALDLGSKIMDTSLADENFYFKYGQMLEMNKDSKKAKEVYKKAIKKNKRFVPAYKVLGMIYYREKKYPEALTYFKKAHKLDPKDFALKRDYLNTLFTYNSKMGAEYIKNKKYVKAVPVFKTLFQIRPKDYNVIVQLANLYYLTEWYNKAIKMLVKNKNIKKNPFELYKLLGMSYMKLKKYSFALKYYNKAVRIKPRNSDIYYKKAKTYEKMESFENAEKFFKKSIQLKFNNKKVHYDYSILLIRNWKYKKALKEMETAEDQGMDKKKTEKYIKSLRLLTKVQDADELYSKEEYEDALDTYKDALKIEDLPKIHVNVGNCLIKLKRYKEAINYLSKAIKRDEKLVMAYFSLAIAYKKQKQPDKAEETYLKAKKILKGEPEIYYKIGQAYEESKDYEEAVDNYKNAFRSKIKMHVIKSAIARTYYKQGIAYFNKDKFEEAGESFRKSLQYNPRYEDSQNALLKTEAVLQSDRLNIIIKKADTHFNNGDYESALVLYEKVLEVDSKLIAVRVRVGETHYRMKNFKMAEIVINDVLQKDSDNINATILLAYIYYDKNEKDKMDDLIDKAKRLASNKMEQMDKLYNILGMLYEGQDDLENAVTHYKKSIKYKPMQVDAYISLGNIYFYKKQYSKAQLMYKEVLNRYKNNTVAMYNLGVIYLKKRQLNKSGELLLRCYQKIPEYEGICFNLGRQYYYQKNYSKALEYMNKAVALNNEKILYIWGLANIYHRSADVTRNASFKGKANDLYTLCMENTDDNQISMDARKALLVLNPKKKLLYKNRYKFDVKYIPLLEGAYSYLYDSRKKRLKKVVTESEEVIWSKYEPAPPSAHFVTEKNFYTAFENLKIKVFDKEKGAVLFEIDDVYASSIEVKNSYLVAYNPDEKNLSVYQNNNRLWQKQVKALKKMDINDQSLFYYNNKSLQVYNIKNGQSTFSIKMKGRLYNAHSVGENILVNYTENKKDYIQLYSPLGKPLWQKKINSIVSVPPTFQNQRIYFSLQNGQVLCYLIDGTRIWKKNTWEEITSQVVQDDTLFITTKKNFIYGLALASGKTTWKYEFPKENKESNFYMVYYR